MRIPGLHRVRRRLIRLLSPIPEHGHRGYPDPWNVSPRQAGIVYETAHRLCYHLAGYDSIHGLRQDLLDALHGHGLEQLERELCESARREAVRREYT